MKPKSAIFTALAYLLCLPGLQQAWSRESEIQFLPSRCRWLANCRPYIVVTLFLSSPRVTQPLNQQQLSLFTLLKVFFFFFFGEVGTQRGKKNKSLWLTQNMLLQDMGSQKSTDFFFFFFWRGDIHVRKPVFIL